jgi:hypothetical protein
VAQFQARRAASSTLPSVDVRVLVVLVLAGEHGERSEPRAAGRGRRRM